MSRKKTDLLRLFLGMLYISAFTFGGGFVIATFMKKKFVDQFHWIEEAEMLDLIAIAQSSPGAIAVNTAILVGWKTFGLTGMLLAVLGTIIPPILILIIISFFYAAFSSNPIVAIFLRGMQVGVAAILLDVVYDLALKIIKRKKITKICIIPLVFILVFFMKINVIYIIIFTLGIGCISAIFDKKGDRI